jgi:hypothetical protein
MAELKTGTVLLAGLAGLAALSAVPEVQAVCGFIPPPWGLIASAILSGAAVAKRIWWPSKPSEATLTTMAQTPAFADLLVKVLNTTPKSVPAPVRDGEITISSDIPQPGDIPGGGL